MIPGVYRNCHHVCTWSVYRSTMKIYNWMIEWGDAEHIAKELGFQRGIRRIRTIHHKRKERSGLTSLFGITGITVSRYHWYHDRVRLTGGQTRGDLRRHTYSGACHFDYSKVKRALRLAFA